MTPDEEAELPELDLTSTRPIEGFKSLGFFTADYASVESGKIYASGAYWTTLTFPVFPATLPACSIVAVLQVPHHEMSHDRSLEIRLLDPDAGATPVHVTAQFRVTPGQLQDFGETGMMLLPVPLYGVQFDRPGDYSFVLSVGGKDLDRYQIHVKQLFGSGPLVRGMPTPQGF